MNENVGCDQELTSCVTVSELYPGKTLFYLQVALLVKGSSFVELIEIEAGGRSNPILKIDS